MEYILEELLRQKRVLAALMTGGMPEEESERGERTENGTRSGSKPQDPLYRTGIQADMAVQKRRNGGQWAGDLFWEETWGGADTGGGIQPRMTELSFHNEASFRRGGLPAEKEAGSPIIGNPSTDERTAREAARMNDSEWKTLRDMGLTGDEQKILWNMGVTSVPGAVEGPHIPVAARWGGRMAETDARALSRAFQRDARRYDGGFISR